MQILISRLTQRMPYLALSLCRSFCCCKATSFTSAAASKKKNLVFLGSPQVSLPVLDALLDASSLSTSIFRVAAIVTQPPSRRDRGRKTMPSPVAQRALEKGFPHDLIFTPKRAGEESFLSGLRALNPNLCITTAYGNILPSKFLDIPPYYTVNVHPSLLPLYREAAPVQRAYRMESKKLEYHLHILFVHWMLGLLFHRKKLKLMIILRHQSYLYNYLTKMQSFYYVSSLQF